MVCLSHLGYVMWIKEEQQWGGPLWSSRSRPPPWELGSAIVQGRGGVGLGGIEEAWGAGYS